MTEPAPQRSPEPAALQVPQQRSLRWLWIPAVPAAVLVGAWWTTNPAPLDGGGVDVEAVTKVGRAVYVGVTADEDDAEPRQLALRDVTVHLSEGEDDVSAEVLVCHGGSISATADPKPFCDEVSDAEGATLDLPEDQLVISVTASTAQQVTVERVELSYREGVQWDTQPVGPGIVVDVRE